MRVVRDDKEFLGELLAVGKALHSRVIRSSVKDAMYLKRARFCRSDNVLIGTKQAVPSIIIRFRANVNKTTPWHLLIQNHFDQLWRFRREISWSLCECSNFPKIKFVKILFF